MKEKKNSAEPNLYKNFTQYKNAHTISVSDTGPKLVT